MPKRLLIILANTAPDRPAEAASPLRQAATAAADYPTEVVIAGRAGVLAFKTDCDSSLYRLIQQAHRKGVTFKVCTTALEAQPGGELIPEIAEVVGGAYIISEAMDDDTVTLTY